jgi:hypothetical protein
MDEEPRPEAVFKDVRLTKGGHMSRLYPSPLLLVCLAFLLEPPVRSEPPNKGDQALAAAIIDKAIEARGGEAALARFPAATSKARFRICFGGRTILTSDESAHDLPERIWGRHEAEENGSKSRQTEVITGDRGWVVMDGKTVDMDKAMVANEREHLYVEWITRLTPLKGKGFRFELLGEARVGDRPSLGIRVSREGHRDVKLFFDKDSGLLLKRENPIKLATGGPESTEEVLFGRYKEIRGAKYPTHFIMRVGDEVSVEGDLTEFKPCEKLDDALFARPKD